MFNTQNPFHRILNNSKPKDYNNKKEKVTKVKTKLAKKMKPTSNGDSLNPRIDKTHQENLSQKKLLN